VLSAATFEQAAEAGEIVMVRIPFDADLDAGRITSSELTQRYLRGSRVMKVFNNILARHLRSLDRRHGR
jgi:predicted dinucleotide-binding enzyme